MFRLFSLVRLPSLIKSVYADPQLARSLPSLVLLVLERYVPQPDDDRQR
jgi:hypothetical protein